MSKITEALNFEVKKIIKDLKILPYEYQIKFFDDMAYLKSFQKWFNGNDKKL